ncbi:L,D-transpeptidase [Variovorax sp. J22G21]|uniref:L,D-transpeptidase n=1 Tax=Variovorax fucosicus TaxID=3053517 RepID=UPI002578B0A2|nr:MULTISPECIES: L,D-transpeptidase [unclassified Variovorax]MDM0037659.1 L,D-transpeptidase [Variovorax sp. J22R193]MDM0062435.1 L,D-transpeptidase [Variovorax sp. J22G21]
MSFHTRGALRLAALLLAALCANGASGADSPDTPSVAAQHFAAAAVRAGDNQRLPFAVVDKVNARVWVFGTEGELRGTAPVLLGLAIGDESVPGIGERKMSEIKPGERTTPAGRFMSEPGRNLRGEDIVWVDYEAAVSMHRVRATNAAERRLERLASPSVRDNRISFGCINVPAAFYDLHIQPAFGQARGIVYVLPETRDPRDRFDFLGTP